MGSVFSILTWLPHFASVKLQKRFMHLCISENRAYNFEFHITSQIFLASVLSPTGVNLSIEGLVALGKWFWMRIHCWCLCSPTKFGKIIRASLCNFCRIFFVNQFRLIFCRLLYNVGSSWPLCKKVSTIKNSALSLIYINWNFMTSSAQSLRLCLGRKWPGVWPSFPDWVAFVKNVSIINGSWISRSIILITEARLHAFVTFWLFVFLIKLANNGFLFGGTLVT